MAYIKKLSLQPSVKVASARLTGYPESTEPYHPFGYYVLGGTDIGGDALKMDGNAAFDTDEEIDKGVGVDATCNPRIGFMQIAENAGIMAAQKASENAPSIKKDDEPTKTE